MPFRILKRPSSHYFIQCVSHGCRSCASTARNVPSPLSGDLPPYLLMYPPSTKLRLRWYFKKPNMYTNPY
ncbi:hypothetical protein EmuJ_000234200 [Echinococcus multilocularis]|uniref:Uncharacterized protein n=1 Tax=Echinococcus multilocularis TaxID=6211 RepID=A0A087W1K2_ECHMU|nr:hypothetical protein EmuJ_000234200 [Echinococcus multilocularis]